MAQIFISHSNLDQKQAAELLAWLHDQGFSSTFLDFDKHKGIPPGADWEQKLYKELSNSVAVILIVTRNWFHSKWCFAEFAQARALGKAIFPLVETATGEKFVSPDIQHLDLVKDREGGLDRLRTALTQILIDSPEGFAWDPTRPPYPGLLAFNEGDAAIYFGRDDSIRQLIERLNARRVMGGEKLLLVLGASGAGKSSLLRAGVLPRLKRAPHNWIVLPPFRPQLQPLSELALAVATGLGDATNWRHWQAALENADLPRTLADLARDLHAAHREKEAHILVTIDQGEELFGGADASQVERFLAVLNAMLDEHLPFLAVMSLRSDYLGELQKEARLTAAFEQFSLKPMPLERVREIIRGPARVAGITVDEAMVTAAIADAQTEDALPLLAFVLRELYDKHGSARHFTEQSYRALGSEGLSPLENAVRRKADEVISAHNPSPEEMQSLKDAFIPAMVRVNAEGEYARRSAAMTDLPARALPLIQKLANARLLTISKDGPESRVEVAHEALLRNWPRLRSWLDEEQEFLIGKNQLEQDLRDWERAAPAQKTDALLTGLKLTRAREWLTAKPLQLSQAEHRFVQESQTHHDAEAARRQRARRRVLQTAVAAAIVLAVVAGIAIQQRRTAKTLRLTASWNFLTFEALRQMSQEGDDDLALLLTRQATQIQKELHQPARLVDYSIYSMLPSGAFRHVLHGHAGAVMTVAFSPDGKYLASGSWNAEVRIWDLGPPQMPPHILGTLDGGVWTLVYSADGKRLAAGSDNGTVYLFDMNRQQDAPTVLGKHGGSVLSVAFSPDGQQLASGSADGTVRLWNHLDAPQPTAQELNGRQGKVWSVAFDPGGARLITGGDDGTVAVWDVAHTEKPERVLKMPQPVTGNSSGGSSTTSGQRHCALTGYDCQSQAVRAVAWSIDGNYIAAGSADKTIAVWDLRRPNAAPVNLTANEGPVWSVAFSSDGKQLAAGGDKKPLRLASGGADTTLRIWTLSNSQWSGPLVLGPGHQGGIHSVVFSPDGKQVATGSEDTTIRVWDLNVSLPSTKILTGHTGAVNAVAFDAASNRLASAGDDHTIKLWDISSGEVLRTLRGHSNTVWSVAFSPDGKRLASGGADKTVRVWDLSNPAAPPRVLDNQSATAWSVAFSPDGQTVASGNADGTARIWDLRQANPQPLVLGYVAHSTQQQPPSQEQLPMQDQPCSHAQFKGPSPHDIYAVAFAPDGKELATGGVDGNVHLWKLDHLSATPRDLPGDTWVCALKFSPDGMTLASGSGDNSIHIWNLRQPAAQPAVLEGHSRNILAVDFSQDGTRLASSSVDQTIRIWDMYAPGSDSQIFPVVGGNIARSVAFSPDGKWLAYGNTDGTIRLLPRPDSLTEAVCDVVWRDLTMEEWRLFVGKGIPYERTCKNWPASEGAPKGAP